MSDIERRASRKLRKCLIRRPSNPILRTERAKRRILRTTQPESRFARFALSPRMLPVILFTAAVLAKPMVEKVVTSEPVGRALTGFIKLPGVKQMAGIIFASSDGGMDLTQWSFGNDLQADADRSLGQDPITHHIPDNQLTHRD